jgi:hypothetical protein
MLKAIVFQLMKESFHNDLQMDSRITFGALKAALFAIQADREAEDNDIFLVDGCFAGKIQEQLDNIKIPYTVANVDHNGPNRLRTIPPRSTEVWRNRKSKV